MRWHAQQWPCQDEGLIVGPSIEYDSYSDKTAHTVANQHNRQIGVLRRNMGSQLSHPSGKITE